MMGCAFYVVSLVRSPRIPKAEVNGLAWLGTQYSLFNQAGGGGGLIQKIGSGLSELKPLQLADHFVRPPTV